MRPRRGRVLAILALGLFHGSCHRIFDADDFYDPAKDGVDANWEGCWRRVVPETPPFDERFFITFGVTEAPNMLNGCVANIVVSTGECFYTAAGGVVTNDQNTTARIVTEPGGEELLLTLDELADDDPANDRMVVQFRGQQIEPFFRCLADCEQVARGTCGVVPQ